MYISFLDFDNHMPHKCTFVSERAERNFKRIMETLSGRPPMSAEKIGAQLFMCTRSARNYLQELEARGMALVADTPDGECPRTAHWTVSAQASTAR